MDGLGDCLLPHTVQGRWTSQPEPLLPVSIAGQVVNAVDFGRLMVARKINVHAHEDQQVSIALKYEGSPDCHLFSNESYLFPRWQNPAWLLGPGPHRLRVTLYYERGHEVWHFRLLNCGTCRGDTKLEPEKD